MPTQHLDRYWVNQPSSLQPDHALNGTNVLAARGSIAAGGYVDVYFTSGPVVSQRMDSRSLSPGWTTAEKSYGKTADTLKRQEREIFALQDKLAVGGRNREIGEAIQRAAKELPEGYNIHIEIENGAAVVVLYLPDTDARIEFDEDSGNRLACEIHEAVASAIIHNVANEEN